MEWTGTLLLEWTHCWSGLTWTDTLLLEWTVTPLLEWTDTLLLEWTDTLLFEWTDTLLFEWTDTPLLEWTDTLLSVQKHQLYKLDGSSSIRYTNNSPKLNEGCVISIYPVS